MEPIYPAGKPPAASGGERQEEAPEPAGPQGWFYRAEASEERPAESADSKPGAAADQTTPASEPAAGAATGSAAEARAADSGTGKADDKPERGEPGSGADADADAGAASPGNGDGPFPDREVMVVPGVPRYHRPGCSTIRFMDEGDLEKRTLRSAAEIGCAPCEACQADAADPAPAGG